MRGTRARHARYEVAATLGSLGLEHRLGDRIDRLSWGTIRRVGLAFALAGKPSLVLLDEPFAGLDTTATLSVKTVLTDLSSKGATVIMSTHEARTARTIVDQVIAMESGRVVGEVGDAVSEGPVDTSGDEGR
jgi:ABC-type multidrug transport system ATPase subunit